MSGGGRLECTKQRRKGRGLCHSAAVRGTDACKLHGGHKLDVAKAKGEARINAWSPMGAGAHTVDYRMAVLGVLQMTWLRLGAYSQLLQRQAVPDAEADSVDELETGGLIGHRFGAAGKDGNIFAQSEEVRALVMLEAQERDRVVRYAKTAHDMGISDRLTSIAERWGDVVATRITLMLDALELTPEQTAMVPTLIQAHLGSIDMDVMGGESK